MRRQCWCQTNHAVPPQVRDELPHTVWGFRQQQRISHPQQVQKSILYLQRRHPRCFITHGVTARSVLPFIIYTTICWWVQLGKKISEIFLISGFLFQKYNASDSKRKRSQHRSRFCEDSKLKMKQRSKNKAAYSKQAVIFALTSLSHKAPTVPQWWSSF